MRQSAPSQPMRITLSAEAETTEFSGRWHCDRHKITPMIIPKRPLAVVGAAIGIRIVFFVGYANVDPWDDTIYLELARQTYADDSASTAPLPLAIAADFSLRRGVIEPIAWAQRLFGVNEIASSLYSLLCALGTLVVTYRLATIHGRDVALTAIGLLAVFPLHVVFSTRMTAESPQVFWAAAMVLAVVELSRCDSRTGRRLAVALFGFSLFVTCWTRIAGLVLVPIAIAAALPLWRDPERRRDLGWLGASGALGFIFAHGWRTIAAERALSALMFEILPEARFEWAPFIVFHVAYPEGTVHQFFKETSGLVAGYPGVHLFGGLALYGIAGAAAALWAVLSRKRAAWLFVGWALWVFVFFQYGFRGLAIDSGALHYYMVAPRTRHLTLLAVPLVIVIARALRELGAKRPRLAGAFLLVVLASGLYGTYTSHAFYRGSMADVRSLATYLKERGTTVRGDAWLVHQLPLYGAHAEQTSTALASGTLVALGGSRGFDVPASEIAPSGSPGAGWEEVFRSPGELHAARGSDLVVYRVR